MVLKNLFTGQQWRNRHREQTYGHGERGGEGAAAAAKSLQSCPTLCDPIDGSPSGSPVPGILQAIVLEWGAIAFSTYTLRKSKLKKIHVYHCSLQHYLQ